MNAEEEVERRWPSPNTSFYEGLRTGFKLGAQWKEEEMAKDFLMEVAKEFEEEA